MSIPRKPTRPTSGDHSLEEVTAVVEAVLETPQHLAEVVEAVLETQELAEALEAGMELEGMEDKARAGAQAMASQSTTGRKRGRRGRSRPIRSIPVVVGITRRRSIPVVIRITRRGRAVVIRITRRGRASVPETTPRSEAGEDHIESLSVVCLT